ncbi:hypothetical protein L204_100391 [Cryptococcus depauperatus]|nr:hypothetical protein L204_02126 [Cryptococcus depauperatus CBS 7855]
MAVALRSNTDLVYLPDHGFAAEEGALRILPQITRQIRRLNVSHNPLGPSGALTLFKGLSTIRTRYSASELGLWGLQEINLAACDINDEAFDSIIAYAKKDVFLRYIYLQGNLITLRDNVESVMTSLNMSNVEMLSLTNNPSIDPEGFKRFMSLLNSSSLKGLHIAACRLPPSAASAIADYVRSSRSKNLEFLLLNGNRLGAQGVTKIVDAIEEANFSLTNVGLLANNYPETTEDEQGLTTLELTIDNYEEGELLEYQVHARLPALLARNSILTKRVRLAATKTIGPARIILNALPVSDEETAKRVISDISSDQPSYNFFRLMDLPAEVINLIVRHVSGDPWALSEGQFTRLRLEAVDREALRSWSERRWELLRGKRKQEESEAILALQNQWLRKGKWDKWEPNM